MQKQAFVARERELDELRGYLEKALFDTPDLQEARALLEELIPTEERTRQPLRPSAVIA